MTSRDKRDQAHFRSNYIEVVERNIPEFYSEKEYQLYGEEKDLSYTFLNGLLSLVYNASSVIPIPDTVTQVSSLYKYFNPESRLTRVSSDDFTRFVLKPLGKSISGFRNREEFEGFLETSALPSIHLNNVTTQFAQSFSATVDVDVDGVPAVEAELLNRLGLLYILNTSGIQTGLTTDLSSIVLSSISDKIYFGKEYTETDAIQNIYEYVWRNREVAGFLDNNLNAILPHPWRMSTSEASDLESFSGTLPLDTLMTMVKIWIDPTEDASNRFTTLLSDSLAGIMHERRETAGPFSKFVRALSYGIYDLEVLTRDIRDLLDIEECPDEFLDHLARYIGWQFISDNPDTWRSQLRAATYAYKAKGTRNAIEYVAGLFVPSSLYTPANDTSGLQELYESYLPNLIYYLIKTESPLREEQDLRPILTSWADKLSQIGVEVTLNYDPNNYDNSIRFLVDAILEYLHHKFGLITINQKDYRESEFWTAQKNPGYFHRGKLCAIPPWEDSRFYQNVGIREVYLTELSSIMIRNKEEFGLGIASDMATKFTSYVTSSIFPDIDPVLAPGFGANNGFKFFTVNPELPINYKEVIQRGEIESTAMFDYWNSKSSEVHIKMDLDDIDFELDEIYR